MYLLELRHLRDMIAAAEDGSFSDAARAFA